MSGAATVDGVDISGFKTTYDTHAGNATAHQDAPALIATHTAIATAHQDAPGLIATHAALPTVHQDAPGLIATHAALPTVHQDAPALIATHTAIATAHQDAPALIATHAAIAAAHHTKYLDSEAISAVEGEATLNLAGVVTMALDVGIATVDMESWHSTVHALQMMATSALWAGDTALHMAENIYLKTTGYWARRTADLGTVYQQIGGEHKFYSIPTGTANEDIASPPLALTITTGKNLLLTGNIQHATDVQIFGQNQTTYGIGVSTSQNRPAFIGIGSGDFLFYPAVTNGVAHLLVVPNGTGAAYISIYDNDVYTSFTNYERLTMFHVGGKAYIRSEAGGTGTIGRMQLQGTTNNYIELYDAGLSRWNKARIHNGAWEITQA